MESHILPDHVFKEMNKLFHLRQKKSKKDLIMSEILNVVVQITEQNNLSKPKKKRHNLKYSPKKISVLKEIIYKLTDRSYVVVSRDKMASDTNVSLDTVDIALRILKETKLFYWMYFKNSHKSTNGYKKIVMFYEEHELFPFVKEHIVSYDLFLKDAFCKDIRNEIIEKMLYSAKNTETHANNTLLNKINS